MRGWISAMWADLPSLDVEESQRTVVQQTWSLARKT